MTIICINFKHVYASVKWPLTCQMFVFRYGQFTFRLLLSYVHLKFEMVLIVNISLTLIREAENPDLTTF